MNENNIGEKILSSAEIYTNNYLDSEYIVIHDIIWEYQMQSFLDELRKRKIDKIVITNTSTALMGLLHFLLTEGCSIEGVETVKYKDGFYEGDKGLLVKIK